MPVLALCLAGWAQSADIPLGDLVKQPKPARKAARVITNDDLPQHPPEPRPLATPANSRATPTGEPEKRTPTSKARPEAKEAMAESGSLDGDPAENNPAAGTKNEPPTGTTANAGITKRIANLAEEEAVEQKIRERLSLALQQSGMSDEQRQTMVEALGQSEAALASFRQQRDTLKELLPARPTEEEDKASASERDSAEKPPQRADRTTEPKTEPSDPAPDAEKAE
jgi:hypothetical protein